MTITTILILVAIGLLLMLLEVFVIPGVGIAGVIGLIFMIAAVYFAYGMDNMTGHGTLGGSVFLSLIALFLSLRAKTWDKASLHTELKGKVNTLDALNIEMGNRGFTVSRLSPSGNARINDKIVEVHTFGEFIDQETEVKVVKIEGNKVYVKLANA